MVLRPRETSCKKLTWRFYKEVAPEDRHKDASGNQERALCNEGVSPGILQFRKILSNMAKYVVPVERELREA